MKAPPGVRRWIRAGRIRSTQDTARRLAERGEPSGTLVSAESQTRGRGQREHGWSSGKGGVYFTLLTRPEVPPKRLAAASLKAAKAVSRVVAGLGLKTRVKAPNDVFASADGRAWRKVAGILLESSVRSGRTEWLLIGVGLNANNRLPKELAEASSLGSLLGRRLDEKKLLAAVLGGLRKERAWT